MRVVFRKFSSRTISWDAIFQDACDFATALPEGRLISISHSEDGNDGVVVVWYYEG